MKSKVSQTVCKKKAKNKKNKKSLILSTTLHLIPRAFKKSSWLESSAGVGITPATRFLPPPSLSGGLKEKEKKSLRRVSNIGDIWNASRNGGDVNFPSGGSGQDNCIPESNLPTDRRAIKHQQSLTHTRSSECKETFHMVHPLLIGLPLDGRRKSTPFAQGPFSYCNKENEEEEEEMANSPLWKMIVKKADGGSERQVIYNQSVPQQTP